MNNSDLYIVLLAAGLSQRLGFAKQLIVKSGMTLLEVKIRLALSFSDNVTVIIPDIEMPWARQILTICQLFPVQIVLNPTPQTGMGQSIQLAYTSLQQQNLPRSSRIVFLTIDQFALTAEHLTQLIQVADSQTVVASRYYSENKPAILGIPVNMPFGFLVAFAPQLQGDKGFGKLLNQPSPIATGYHITPIDIPELAWDIDTPEQFVQVETRFNLTVPHVNNDSPTNTSSPSTITS